MVEGRPSVLLVLASSGWGGAEKAVVDLANALAPELAECVPGCGESRSNKGSDISGCE